MSPKLPVLSLLLTAWLCGLCAASSATAPCYPESQFACRTPGLCVPRERVRDGLADCPDGADEECPTDHHQCRCDPSKCLEPRLVGDGHKDCDDGSDEGDVEGPCETNAIGGDLVAQERRKRQVPESAELVAASTQSVVQSGTTLFFITETLATRVGKSVASVYRTRVMPTVPRQHELYFTTFLPLPAVQDTYAPASGLGETPSETPHVSREGRRLTIDASQQQINSKLRGRVIDSSSKSQTIVSDDLLEQMTENKLNLMPGNELRNPLLLRRPLLRDFRYTSTLRKDDLGKTYDADTITENTIKGPTITLFGFAHFTTFISGTEVVFVPTTSSKRVATAVVREEKPTIRDAPIFPARTSSRLPLPSTESQSLMARMIPDLPSSVQEEIVDPYYDAVLKTTRATPELHASFSRLPTSTTSSTSYQTPSSTSKIINEEISPSKTSTESLPASSMPKKSLHPTGLVTSLNGTYINSGSTTFWTTLVYGTYIKGTYAHIIRSTSSIIFPMAATQNSESSENQALPTVEYFTPSSSHNYNTESSTFELPTSFTSSISRLRQSFDFIFETLQSNASSIEPSTTLPVDAVILTNSFFLPVNNEAKIESDTFHESSSSEASFKILTSGFFYNTAPSSSSDQDLDATTFTIFKTVVNDGNTHVITRYETLAGQKTSSSPVYPFEIPKETLRVSSSETSTIKSPLYFSSSDSRLEISPTPTLEGIMTTQSLESNITADTLSISSSLESFEIDSHILNSEPISKLISQLLEQNVTPNMTTLLDDTFTSTVPIFSQNLIINSTEASPEQLFTSSSKGLDVVLNTNLPQQESPSLSSVIASSLSSSITTLLTDQEATENLDMSTKSDSSSTLKTQVTTLEDTISKISLNDSLSTSKAIDDQSYNNLGKTASLESTSEQISVELKNITTNTGSDKVTIDDVDDLEFAEDIIHPTYTTYYTTHTYYTTLLKPGGGSDIRSRVHVDTSIADLNKRYGAYSTRERRINMHATPPVSIFPKSHTAFTTYTVLVTRYVSGSPVISTRVQTKSGVSVLTLTEGGARNIDFTPPLSSSRTLRVVTLAEVPHRTTFTFHTTRFSGNTAYVNSREQTLVPVILPSSTKPMPAHIATQSPHLPQQQVHTPPPPNDAVQFGARIRNKRDIEDKTSENSEYKNHSNIRFNKRRLLQIDPEIDTSQIENFWPAGINVGNQREIKPTKVSSLLKTGFLSSIVSSTVIKSSTFDITTNFYGTYMGEEYAKYARTSSTLRPSFSKTGLLSTTINTKIGIGEISLLTTAYYGTYVQDEYSLLTSTFTSLILPSTVYEGQTIKPVYTEPQTNSEPYPTTNAQKEELNQNVIENIRPSTTSNYKLGLISSHTSEALNNGKLTKYTTNIYGTMIGGVYAQRAHVNSEVSALVTSINANRLDLKNSISPTLDNSKRKSGLVSSDVERIVKGTMATYLTTEVYGTYIAGQYAQIAKTLTRTEKLPFKTAGPSSNPQIIQKMGLVSSKILSSKVDAGITTVYYSEIVGTYVHGGYAHIGRTVSTILNPPQASTTTSSSTIVPSTASSTPSRQSLKTGFLSSVKRTEIKNRMTTIHTTEFHGTYVDGIYAHIQKSTSKVLLPNTRHKTGLLSIKTSVVVNQDKTTLLKTEIFGTYMGSVYAHIAKTSSRILATPTKTMGRTKRFAEEDLQYEIVGTFSQQNSERLKSSFSKVETNPLQDEFQLKSSRSDMRETKVLATKTPTFKKYPSSKIFKKFLLSRNKRNAQNIKEYTYTNGRLRRPKVFGRSQRERTMSSEEEVSNTSVFENTRNRNNMPIAPSSTLTRRFGVTNSRGNNFSAFRRRNFPYKETYDDDIFDVSEANTKNATPQRILPVRTPRRRLRKPSLRSHSRSTETAQIRASPSRSRKFTMTRTFDIASTHSSSIYDDDLDEDYFDEEILGSDRIGNKRSRFGQKKFYRDEDIFENDDPELESGLRKGISFKNRNPSLQSSLNPRNENELIGGRSLPLAPFARARGARSRTVFDPRTYRKSKTAAILPVDTKLAASFDNSDQIEEIMASKLNDDDEHQDMTEVDFDNESDLLVELGHFTEKYIEPSIPLFETTKLSTSEISTITITTVEKTTPIPTETILVSSFVTTTKTFQIMLGLKTSFATLTTTVLESSTVLPHQYTYVIKDDITKTVLSSTTVMPNFGVEPDQIRTTISEIIITTSQIETTKLVPIKIGYGTRTDTITSRQTLTTLTTLQHTIFPQSTYSPPNYPPFYPMQFLPYPQKSDAFSFITSSNSFLTTETISSTKVIPIYFNGKTILSTLTSLSTKESIIVQTTTMKVPTAPSMPYLIPNPFYVFPPPPPLTTQVTVLFTVNGGNVVSVVTPVTLPAVYPHSKVARSVHSTPTKSPISQTVMPIESFLAVEIQTDPLVGSLSEISTSNIRPSSSITSADYHIKTITKNQFTEIYEQPAILVHKFPLNDNKDVKPNIESLAVHNVSAFTLNFEGNINSKQKVIKKYQQNDKYSNKLKRLKKIALPEISPNFSAHAVRASASPIREEEIFVSPVRRRLLSIDNSFDETDYVLTPESFSIGERDSSDFEAQRVVRPGVGDISPTGPKPPPHKAIIRRVRPPNGDNPPPNGGNRRSVIIRKKLNPSTSTPAVPIEEPTTPPAGRFQRLVDSPEDEESENSAANKGQVRKVIRRRRPGPNANANGPVVGSKVILSRKPFQSSSIPSDNQSPLQSPIATVPITYFTTFTYLTTFLHGLQTSYTSTESVVSTVSTQPINSAIVSVIQSQGGYSGGPDHASLIHLASRTFDDSTTVVNLASRLQLFNDDIYRGIIGSNLKSPIHSRTQPTGRAVGAQTYKLDELAMLPKTLYTFATHFYTFYDGLNIRSSQSEEIMSKTINDPTPFSDSEFGSTINAQGYLRVGPSTRMVNLGSRNVGGILTEINLGMRTLAHFDGIRNAVVEPTPSIPPTAPKTDLVNDNFLNSNDNFRNNDLLNPLLLPSYSSNIFEGPQSQQAQFETPSIRDWETTGSQPRVVSTLLSSPRGGGILRTIRPGVYMRIRPVSSRRKAELQSPKPIISSEPILNSEEIIVNEEPFSFTTPTEEIEPTSTREAKQQLPETTTEQQGPRKRIKFTLRRPQLNIPRPQTRPILPSRQAPAPPRVVVVTRPPGVRPSRPGGPPIKVSRKVKPPPVRYDTFTTMTTLPVIFGLDTSYRNVIVTTSTPVTPPPAVILTFFTTTTFTVPYTVSNGVTLFTTHMETNSRVVTQTGLDVPIAPSTTTPPQPATSVQFGPGGATTHLMYPPDVEGIRTTSILYPGPDGRIVGTKVLRKDANGAEMTSVFGQIPPERPSVVPQTFAPIPVTAQRGLGPQLNLGTQSKVNLVTRVSGGVTLIVASTPLTLQPTVLTDAVRMQEPFQDNNAYSTKTFYTTYTYSTTFFSGNHPVISTREEVVTNLFTVPVSNAAAPVMQTEPIPMPQMPQLPSIGGGDEGLTVFETRQRLVPTTRYNTHTMYATVFNGSTSFLTAVEEVNSDVFTLTETYTVTRTIYPSKTNPPHDIVQPSAPPMEGSFLTRTYYSTTTNLVTLYQGPHTIISTIEDIETKIVTLSIPDKSSMSTSPFIAPTSTSELPLVTTTSVRTEYSTQTHIITLFHGDSSELTSIEEVVSREMTDTLVMQGDVIVTSTINQHSATSTISPSKPAFLPSEDVHPKDEIELVPSIKTIYTTNTYYTTLFSGENPIVNSREEVQTGQITLFVHPSVIAQNEQTSSLVPTSTTPSLIYLTTTEYSTYTLFTTLFKGDDTIIISSTQVVPQVVTATITPGAAFNEPSPSSSLDPDSVLTLFTTYTYYSSILDGTTSKIASSEQVITQVVTVESTPVLSRSIEVHSPSLMRRPESTSSEDIQPTLPTTNGVLTGSSTSVLNGSTVIFLTDFITHSKANEAQNAPSLDSSMASEELPHTETVVLQEKTEFLGVNNETTTAMPSDTLLFITGTDGGITRLTEAEFTSRTPLVISPSTEPAMYTTSASGGGGGGGSGGSGGGGGGGGIRPGAVIDLADVLGGNSNIAGNIGDAIKDIISMINKKNSKKVNTSQAEVDFPIEDKNVPLPPREGITVSNAEEPVYIPIGAIGRSSEVLRPVASSSVMTIPLRSTQVQPEIISIYSPDTMMLGFTPLSSASFSPVDKIEDRNAPVRTDIITGADTIFIAPTQVQVKGETAEVDLGGVVKFSNLASDTSIITGDETIFFELPHPRQPVKESSIPTIYFDSSSRPVLYSSELPEIIPDLTTIYGTYTPDLPEFKTTDSTLQLSETKEVDNDATKFTSGDTTIFYPIGSSSEATKYITSVESITRTLTLTSTTVFYTRDSPLTVTSIFTTTISPRTFISTIIGTRTLLGTEQSSTQLRPVGMISITASGGTLPTQRPPIAPSSSTRGLPTDIFNLPPRPPPPTRPAAPTPPKKPVVIFTSRTRPTEPPRPKAPQGPKHRIPFPVPKTTLPPPPSTKPRPTPPRPTPGPKDLRCVPDCGPREVCRQLDGGVWACLCKPGHARRTPSSKCEETQTYAVAVKVVRMGEQPALAVPPSTELRTLAKQAAEGLLSAFNATDVRENLVDADVQDIKPAGPEGLLFNFTVRMDRRAPPEAQAMMLKDQLVRSLAESNFSLGNSDLLVSEALPPAVQDFNECYDRQFHDCSMHALCDNLPGSYNCTCKAGYQDLDPFAPGRSCSGEILDCDYCYGRGDCYMNNDDKMTCRCHNMNFGRRCQINGLALAIALPSGVAVLFMFIFCLFCCRRQRTIPRHPKKPPKVPPPASATVPGGGGMFRGLVPPGGTLDRKAMIDSSSESSGEHRSPMHAYDGFLQDDLTLPRRVKSSSELSLDRSYSNFSVPQIVIPRARHHHPKPQTGEGEDLHQSRNSLHQSRNSLHQSRNSLHKSRNSLHSKRNTSSDEDSGPTMNLRSLEPREIPESYRGAPWRQSQEATMVFDDEDSRMTPEPGRSYEETTVNPSRPYRDEDNDMIFKIPKARTRHDRPNPKENII